MALDESILDFINKGISEIEERKKNPSLVDVRKKVVRPEGQEREKALAELSRKRHSHKDNVLDVVNKGLEELDAKKGYDPFYKAIPKAFGATGAGIAGVASEGAQYLAEGDIGKRQKVLDNLKLQQTLGASPHVEEKTTEETYKERLKKAKTPQEIEEAKRLAFEEIEEDRIQGLGDLLTSLPGEMVKGVGKIIKSIRGSEPVKAAMWNRARGELYNAITAGEVSPEVGELIARGLEGDKEALNKATETLKPETGEGYREKSWLAKKWGENVGEPFTRDMKETAAFYRRAAERVRPKTKYGSVLYYTTSAIEGVGVNLLPALAATYITKNPAVGLSVMFPMVYAKTYSEAREEGKSATEAAQTALVYAASETITELGPINVIAKNPAGGLIKRVLKGAKAEGFQETLNQAMQEAYDEGILGKDTPPEEIGRRLLDSGIIGAIGGGGLAVLFPEEGKKPSDQISKTRQDLTDSIISSLQEGSATIPEIIPLIKEGLSGGILNKASLREIGENYPEIKKNLDILAKQQELTGKTPEEAEEIKKRKEAEALDRAGQEAPMGTSGFDPIAERIAQPSSPEEARELERRRGRSLTTREAEFFLQFNNYFPSLPKEIQDDIDRVRAEKEARGEAEATQKPLNLFEIQNLLQELFNNDLESIRFVNEFYKDMQKRVGIGAEKEAEVPEEFREAQEVYEERFKGKQKIDETATEEPPFESPGEFQEMERVYQEMKRRSGKAAQEQEGKKPLYSMPPDSGIPEFKNTREAMAFGESATPEQVEALKAARQESLEKSDGFREAGNLQAAMDEVVRAQFFREAIGESEGTAPPSTPPPMSRGAQTLERAGLKKAGEEPLYSKPKAKTVKVNKESLNLTVLEKMSDYLKSLGYDSRGPYDVLDALQGRTIAGMRLKPVMDKSGIISRPDWADAYEYATSTSKEREAKARAGRKEIATENINRERVRKLGKTEDIREAGYITPEGEYIDLSGKKEGGKPGVRSFDHREVGGVSGMQEFVATGNIRMDANSGFVDIKKRPTPKQYDKLREVAKVVRGEVTLDLTDGLGEYREDTGYYREPGRSFGHTYTKGTSFEEIKADIEKFYKGEAVKKQPLYSKKRESFFSPLLKAAGAIKAKALPAKSVINQLKKSQGVKQAEINVSGLEAWLEGKDKVSKEDLVNFLQESEIDIIDKTGGITEAENNYKQAHGKLRENLMDEGYTETGALEYIEDALNDNLSASQGAFIPKERKRLINELKRTYDGWNKEPGSLLEIPKFASSNYRLPGGEPGSYREIRLERPSFGVPDTTGWTAEKAESGRGFHVFDANGYMITAGERNVYGHLWTHDPSRLSGIAPDDRAYSPSPETAIEDAALAVMESKSFVAKHWKGIKNVIAHIRGDIRIGRDGKRRFHVAEIQSDLASKIHELEQKIETEKQSPENMKRLKEGVANLKELLPWGDNWYELALKKALEYAAQNNLDGISLDVGLTQIKRWEDLLRQKVDRIEWNKVSENEVEIIATKKGNIVFHQNLPIEGETLIGSKRVTLGGLLGKKIAGTIRKEFPDKEIYGAGDKRSLKLLYKKNIDKLYRKHNSIVEAYENDYWDEIDRLGKEFKYEFDLLWPQYDKQKEYYDWDLANGFITAEQYNELTNKKLGESWAKDKELREKHEERKLKAKETLSRKTIRANKEYETGTDLLLKEYKEALAGYEKKGEIGPERIGGNFEGDDLTIGGEFYKTLYDEKSTGFLNRYGKRWGGKLQKFGEVPAPVPGFPKFTEKRFAPAHVFDITPSMRRDILAVGQPLFSKKTKYSMAGEQAIGAPKGQLAKAQELLAEGKSKKEVWKETGWLKGGEGKWKFEIDDSGAKLHRRKGKNFIDNFTIDVAGTYRLGDMLDHAKIYEAYPELKELPVKILKGDFGIKGAYDEIDDTIKMVAPKSRYGQDKEAFMSTLLHEIQHKIQAIEGFARGGSPEMVPEIKRELRNKAWAIKQRYSENQREYIEKRTKEIGGNSFEATIKAQEEWWNSLDNKEAREFKKAIKEYDVGVGTSGLSDFQIYQNLAGEIEARDTSKRTTLTAEERREQMPYESQGIPRNQWIIKDSDKGTSFSVEIKTGGNIVEQARSELVERLGEKDTQTLLTKGVVRLVTPQEAADITGDTENAPKAQGFFLDGVSYLIPENIEQGKTWNVLMHELGEHWGYEAIFGEKLAKEIEDSFARKKEPAIAEAVKRVVDANTPASRQTKEALAYFIEEKANRDLPLWKRIMAQIKAWLVKHTGVNPEIFTEDDYVALAVSAIRKAAIKPAIIPQVQRGDLVLERAGLKKKGVTPSQYSMGEIPPKYMYSPLTKAAKSPKLPGVIPAQSVINQLKKIGGIKDAEIRVSGLSEWLEGKDKVSKEDLVKFLEANEVMVETVQAGGLNEEAIFERAQEIYDKAFDNLMQNAINENPDLQDEDFEALTQQVADEISWSDCYAEAEEEADQETVYPEEDYRAPGENEGYVELVMKRPEEYEEYDFVTEYSIDEGIFRDGDSAVNKWGVFRRRKHGEGPGKISAWQNIGWYNTLEEAEKNKPEDAVEKRTGPKKFPKYRSHWNVDNPIAHIRGDMRKRSGGGITFHVAEIQSELAKRIYELETESKKVQNLHLNQEELDELRKLLPWGDKWFELATKKAIEYAVAEGVDTISWDTGIVQVRRWEDALRKQVDAIEWEKRLGPKLPYVVIRASQEGARVFDEEIPLHGETEIEDESVTLNGLIGKRLADEIRDSKETKGAFEGDDLAIGGEFFKKLYDEKMVNFLNRYSKKWGGKVETVKPDFDIGQRRDQTFYEKMHRLGAISEDERDWNLERVSQKKVHYFNIPDSMRKDIILAGQPLFSMPPKIRHRPTTREGVEGAEIEIPKSPWEEVTNELTEKEQRINLNKAYEAAGLLRRVESMRKRGRPNKAGSFSIESLQGKDYLAVPEDVKEFAAAVGVDYQKTPTKMTDVQRRAEEIVARGDITEVLKILKKAQAGIRKLKPEEVLVIRKVNARCLQNFVSLFKSGESLDEINERLEAYKENIFKITHDMSSERGLQLRILQEEVGPARISSVFAQMKRKFQKKDKVLFNAACESMKLGNDKPMAALLKYWEETKEDPTFMDYVYEYWYNGILSGVPTHLVNLTSNTTWALWQVGVHKPMMAAIDPIVARFQGRKAEYYIDEIIPALAGIKKGFKIGGKAAGEVIIKGYTTDAKLDKWALDMGKTIGAFERSPNKHLRNLSKVITVPTKALRAMDVWANQMGYQSELAAICKRKEKKGEGSFEYWMQNPTQEMMDEAAQFADYSTFMDEPGRLTKMLEKARNEVVVGRLIVPFIRTISNLTKRGLEMTPVVGAFLGGKPQGREVSQRIAKQIQGLVIGLIIASLAADDRLTGAAPTNKAEREAFYRQGKIPWAIRIGDRWLQYRRLEPFNAPIAAIAITHDAIKRGGGEIGTGLVLTIGAGIINNIIDSSYLSGLTDTLKAVNEYDRTDKMINNMIDRTVASFFPPFSSFARSLVRASEAWGTEGAKVRKPKGIVETIEASTPFFSEKITPRKDVWGKEIVIPGNPLMQWLPWKTSKVGKDKVETEIERLHRVADLSYPGMPTQYVMIRGKRVDLTPEQFETLITESGREAKKKLDSAVGTRYWDRCTDLAKKKRIRRIIDRARAKVRNRIKREITRSSAFPGVKP